MPRSSPMALCDKLGASTFAPTGRPPVRPVLLPPAESYDILIVRECSDSYYSRMEEGGAKSRASSASTGNPIGDCPGRDSTAVAASTDHSHAMVSPQVSPCVLSSQTTQSQGIDSLPVTMAPLNPIIPGFTPDPSICCVGNDFFVATSTFEFFPGVPIYHSNDLITWRLIGHALNRPSQLNMRAVPSSGGVWAPTLRHHKGKFYMTTVVMHGKGSAEVSTSVRLECRL